jgi:hypothetical protein
MDLILVNNTGLVVSLGGGGLITPENLTLTTSSASLPPEAEIKMELIREVTTTELIFARHFFPECLSNRLQLSASRSFVGVNIFYTNIFTLIKAKYIVRAAK